MILPASGKGIQPDFSAFYADVWILALNGDEFLDWVFRSNDVEFLGYPPGQVVWIGYDFDVGEGLGLRCDFAFRDDAEVYRPARWTFHLAQMELVRTEPAELPPLPTKP